jgi:hypothetical protein
MACEEVLRILSDGDGRALRGRALRSHLRSCASCQSFRAALKHRPAELAALAPPMPAAAGIALLAHLLPAGKSAAAATGATAAASAGGGVASTLAIKAAVTVAILGTGTGTALITTHHTPAPASPVRHHRPVGPLHPAARGTQRAAKPAVADRAAAGKSAHAPSRSHRPGPRAHPREQSRGASRNAHGRNGTTSLKGQNGQMPRSQPPQRPAVPAPARRPIAPKPAGRADSKGSPALHSPPGAQPAAPSAAPSPADAGDAGHPSASPGHAKARAPESP